MLPTPGACARISSLLLVLTLAACGGGGGDGGGSSTPSGASKLTLALASGDPSGLAVADRDDLLRQATEMAIAARDAQAALVRDVYGAAPIELALNHGTNSIALATTNSTLAQPFIVSDNGSPMAMVARVGTGRGLAYGADVLAWMAGGTREAQHWPLFSRAFTWLVTGRAEGSLPTTIRFAVHGYAAASVNQLVTRLGKTAQAVDCDLSVPNSCWQGLDLLVFGAGSRNDPALTARVREYLAAGKPVIYLHPNWINSDGGRRVLAALGMDLGGYPGNYFAPAAGVSVSAGRTTAQALAAADALSPLVRALQMMARSDLQFDFAADPAPTQAITLIHNELARMQEKGFAPFAEPETGLHRRLVLWADLWRPGIEYGKLSRTGDSDEFLRAYASDSWLVFNRAVTTVARAGQGDYMPVAAQSLPVASGWEVLEVTIAQASGKTAIGRGAVPGRAVTVEILDDAGLGYLGLQTNLLRAWGNPLADARYDRPRRPHSFTIPLARGASTVFVSPAGGPLFLSYEGGAAGKTVKLRVKGGARYAHFDFTRPVDVNEQTAAVAALARGDFGWQTAKFVGGEIQQTIGYAKSVMGNFSPEQYVVDRVKGLIFDSNHVVNGYSNIALAPRVAQLCAEFGWECSGAKHDAPSVQHFVGWIATCGFLCSGNPSDGFAGIAPGWGWWHELGHNTVPRSQTLLTCGTECNNNILSSASALRMYARTGEDVSGDRINHKGLYLAAKTELDRGLSGAALTSAVKASVWAEATDQNIKRALHFQLAYLYTRLRHGQVQAGADEALEFFTLLSKGDRLVARAWDAANPGKYAMGRFADNKIGNEDLVYVLASRILGRDLRLIFEMYGVPVSDVALGSVADLGLPVQERVFYALAPGKGNQLATGSWISMGPGAPPAYPF